MDAWLSMQRTWMEMMSRGTAAGEAGRAAAPPDPVAAWRGFFETAGKGPWPDLSGMQHVLSSLGAYGRLFDAWTRATGAAGREEDSSDLSARMFDAWREIAEDLTKRWAGLFSFGPAAGPGGEGGATGLSGFAEELLKSFEPLRTLWVEVLAPWKETAEKLWHRTAAVMGKQPSAGTVEEFHKAWMEAYEETVGRVVRIPSVGPAREKHDLVYRCVDAAARWHGAYLEFALEMQIPAREAFEKVAGKLATLITPESTPEDFQRFYEELTKETEARLFELFKSRRFAEAMKITLSTSLDFFKLTQELMELELKGTPIVTRSEMDEVEQELVATRRKVERQAAEIAALKSALGKKGKK
jgi:hypothetical protein